MRIGSKYLGWLQGIKEIYIQYLGINSIEFQEGTRVFLVQGSSFRCNYDRCVSKTTNTAIQIEQDRRMTASETFGFHQECLEALTLDPRLESIN